MIFNAYSDTKDGLFGLSVRSAGHIFAQKGRRIFRPNGREDWLLFYVAKGKERFFLDRAIDAEEGSFILFRPGEKQDHVTVGDVPAEFYYVHFFAPADFDPFGLSGSKVYSAKVSTRVRDLFEQIIDELQRKQPFYEKICVSGFFDILGLLARRIANRDDPNERYADRITFVIQRMNREYGDGCSLEDYASLCGMSKFHFLRIFRQMTGSSPVEYRNRIRLEHAKEFLEDLSIPISEVGLRAGFSSPSYFSDAFKKKTGLSPMQYRKNVMSRK